MTAITGTSGNCIPAFIAAAFLLILPGCGDEPDLPTSVTIDPGDFGANDTTFVRVRPDWTASRYGWVNPGELHIAYDGFFYVADERDGGRVVRLKLDGSIARADLFVPVVDTSGRAPVGLGQDSKLNLFMVDGSNLVFARNTLADQIGIAGVVQSFDVIDLATGDRHAIDNSAPLYAQIDSLAEQGIDSVRTDYGSIVTTTAPDTIAAFSREYVFYADASGERASRFSDVDGGPRGEGVIYLADRGNDRIARVRVEQSRVLELADGTVSYSYTGTYLDDAVEFGQGQVSTNNPTSVATAGSGASVKLYFTQSDGNFLFQRLRFTDGAWQFDIDPGGGTPLVELDYFGAPVAVAVGEGDEQGLGLFYVADSAQNRVTAYYASGATFRQVAVTRELIDLEPGQSIERALREQNFDWRPELNHPLIGYQSAEDVEIQVEPGETLLDAVARAGYEFDETLNADLDPNATYDETTTVTVSVPVATTVEVNFPTLDRPRGVATKAGVVYIADSGHNRIVRYQRSDSDAYIPEDPNFP
ncbi:MAG: hypothetical protein MAG453_01970 [Calditrichaeota bacterium]|nr:hypothetical protein [Calditrichota bacterium]